MYMTTLALTLSPLSCLRTVELANLFFAGDESPLSTAAAEMLEVGYLMPTLAPWLVLYASN